MKKTRFLALILVVSMMLMGAGYAYWSETLTINNVVKTGNLDFQFTAADVVGESDYMLPSTASVNSACDNVVDVFMNQMYPGAQAKITLTLKNTGTMKAKVNGFDIPSFTQKPYIQCAGLKVGGSTVTLAGTSLDNLATALNGKNIQIEPLASETFEITIKIDPNATEAQIAENLDTDAEAIKFSIGAIGRQYNDPN